MTATEGTQPRALRLAQRMDRLGVPASALATRADLDRQAVARAREGRARPATYGRLEKALDDLENEMGADTADPVVATVELPDGTRLTFRGISAEDAARAVAAYLRERDGA